MKFDGIVHLLFVMGSVSSYSIFEEKINFLYDLQCNVELIPDVSASETDTVTQWSFNGTLIIQRINEQHVALQISLDRISEELDPIMKPFILKSLNESSIFLRQHPQKIIEMPENEPIWSANIKRGIAALFQIEGSSENGAYVSNEFGLNGLCPTEYYVVNSSDSLSISKIYDMDRCTIPSGIFEIRSNIPINLCEMNKNKAMHAVTSRLGEYKLMKLGNSKYLLKSIHAESKSNVQASESYYPQFIFSKIFVNLKSQSGIEDKNRIKFDDGIRMFQSDFTYVHPTFEATGGRSPKTHDQVIQTVIDMLAELTQNLENKELNFDEPYMETISEILRLTETMNFDALKKLYDQIDIGTSYKQETSKNIFLEILPRVGTVSSVLLAKDLITGKHIRSTTAVQLLTALPFFITEISHDLVKECEEFLHIGPDRPDVKHSGVLSYSTMINKAYVVGALTSEQFEKYVKMVFDMFLNSFNYEQQMLYLEAMGNLQLGNVPNYLQPIIQADYSQTTDIRFLAIFATIQTAYSRSTQVFETYWPIFNSKTTPLQLRIAAFQMLLVSAQTPGRLLGLFNVIKNENCPHMINFYRTTMLSISESTNSCLAHLKRLVLYMRRHLPPPPPKKYWITGNYIFDYKDRKFQIGSLVQVMMIGDRRRDLPLIVFLKFDTEAMGRFTGQLGLYIKARGLSDAVLDRIYSMNLEKFKFEELSNILKIMKMQKIDSTPLHLELILQIEGKTVLSYYLNQTTFYKLTDGDIINRINAVLRTDSHINMQLVRRPFVIKHGFSTLIGTPAYILLENTMIASIRGSTTQNIEADQLIRRNQIDLRYSTYAVSKILSYNPLDDIEFSTIREQGFLVYLPINNEIKLNLFEQFISFSFYRKEPITSGMSLKSRTRSFSGVNEISKQNNHVPVFKFNLEDAGINVLIGHNVESSKENLMFLFESDIHTSAKVFTKTPYSIVQNLLTLISMIQLTSTHISRDKHLTVLLVNEPKSKVDIEVRYKTEDFSSTSNKEHTFTIDCNLLHILDYDSLHSKQLHKWEFTAKYTSFKQSKSSKAVVSLVRKTKNGEKWKLCVTNSFDSLIHFKKPLKFTSIVAFGEHNDTVHFCPIERSKINVTLSVGSPKHATETYDAVTVPEDCTKETIKFLPSPHFGKCQGTDLEKILAITDIKLDVTFDKMPNIFYDVASRIDHVLSAFMPTVVTKLNISESINLELALPADESQQTKLVLNQNKLTIPFNVFQLRHGNFEQSMVDYSFTSICSLYKDNLNTFGNHDMILTEAIRKSNSHNEDMLLFADCSEIPRLAIFVHYRNGSNDFLQIKFNVGSTFVTIKGEEKPILLYNSQEYDLSQTSFAYPSEEKFIRISLNDDSLIEIENDLLKAKVQYNLKSLLSISVPTIMKGKICGLCNVHKNKYC